jgi:hypothetical protein
LRDENVKVVRRRRHFYEEDTLIIATIWKSLFPPLWASPRSQICPRGCGLRN